MKLSKIEIFGRGKVDMGSRESSIQYSALLVEHSVGLNIDQFICVLIFVVTVVESIIETSVFFVTGLGRRAPPRALVLLYQSKSKKNSYFRTGDASNVSNVLIAKIEFFFWKISILGSKVPYFDAFG